MKPFVASFRKSWIFVLIVLQYYSTGYEISDENRYKIVWGAGSGVDLEPSQSLSMRTAEGERYECAVPLTDLKTSDIPHNYSDDIKDILDKIIKTNPCSTRVEYYWSYELCHNTHVRQFHEEVSQDKTSVLQEYYLGYHRTDNKAVQTVPSVRPPKILIGEVAYPFYKTEFTNGTFCDLTNTGRSSSVLYICHEGTDGAIIQVSEIESCKYEVVFATRYLCSNAAYTIPKRSVIPVSCAAHSGTSSKPAALIEFENEEKQFNHLGMSNLAGLLGSAFKHIQVETERRDNTLIYRIRAINSEPSDNSHGPSDGMDHAAPKQEGTSRSYETPRATPTVHSRPAVDGQLIAFLRGEFCLVGRTAGWWMHELCYKRNVTQFHQDERGKRIQQVLLGKWDREAHDDWVSKQPNRKIPPTDSVPRRHQDLFYGDGEFCNEINDRRQSIVKIRCHSSANGIYLSFDEQSTCQYSVLVESTSFCDMSDEDWQTYVL